MDGQGLGLSQETLDLLRPYVVKQLEPVSEADNDVLADFVLELLKSEGDEATIKRNAKDQLAEFLEGGDAVVDDIFRAIKTRSYDSNSKTASVVTPPAHGNAGAGSRKRTYEDEDIAMQDAGFRQQGRPTKASRRSRGDYAQRNGGRHMQQQAPMLPNFNFDPSDPMATMMAFQQAIANGMISMPGQAQQTKRHTGKRCRDYDTKGVCYRGADCRFDHGDDFQVAGQPGRGRGRASTSRDHSDPSMPGPSHDPTNTTLVIKNIPDDSFSESAVEAFFSPFGNITSITLQPARHIAIIAFETHQGAQAAYSSPKSIFDNRFVTCAWARPSAPAAPVFDPVAQAKAQERFEAQRAAREAKAELDRKVAQHAAEQAALLERLAHKTGGAEAKTLALKAKLAALEAEAKALGLDPEGPGRGRGHGFRGRGAPRGRGRGGMLGGPAVKRLDNRPRAVSVAFEGPFDESREEGLRQYLLFTDQIAYCRVQALPGKEDAALVTFAERFRAEMFVAGLAGKEDMPHVGRVRVGWVANNDVPEGAWPVAEEQTGMEVDVGMADKADGNEAMTDRVDEDPQPREEPERTRDYDVADDDMRWTQ